MITLLRLIATTDGTEGGSIKAIDVGDADFPVGSQIYLDEGLMATVFRQPLLDLTEGDEPVRTIYAAISSAKISATELKIYCRKNGWTND